MSSNSLLNEINKLKVEVSENYPHNNMIDKGDVTSLINESRNVKKSFHGVDTKIWKQNVLPSLYSGLCKDIFHALVILEEDAFTSELPNIYKERYGGKLVLSSSYISLSCDNGDTYWFISGNKVKSYMRGMKFNQIILAK